MSDQQKNIERRFTGWKIYIPIIIGLSISFWLVNNNLSTPTYEQVKDGIGTFIWQDTNHNEVIDYHLENEFIPSNNGNYIKITGWDRLNKIQWRNSSFFWLFLALIMMLIRDLAYMIRIRVLTKNDLNWKQSFNVILIWEFISALTPGVVGGAAVAMFLLKREKIEMGRSTSIVLSTAMLDNLFYIITVPALLLIVGPHIFLPDSLSTEITNLFWVAYGIIASVFILLLVGILIKPNWLKQLITLVFSLPFLRRWKNQSITTGNEMINTGKMLRKETPLFWMKATAATFLSWTARYLVINCIIQAFFHVSLFEHLQILARELGMWLIMLVSPTPGGSGIAEYTFSIFMEGFIPIGLAGIVAVVWRLISYYPYLIIGSVILPNWLQKTSSNG